MTIEPTRDQTPFARLRQFVEPTSAAERCELCAREIGPTHDHLLEPGVRHVVCACGACAVLFSDTSDLRYKRIPRESRSLPGFRLTDGQWESLRLPIELAFIYRSSTQDRIVAAYPSPAGPTESALTLDTWEDIERANPVLTTMRDDVEALLVNRVGHTRAATTGEYYIAPIDQCYALVGIIRANWSGLSGGTTVWGEITRFFAELASRSTPVSEVTNA